MIHAVDNVDVGLARAYDSVAAMEMNVDLILYRSVGSDIAVGLLKAILPNGQGRGIARTLARLSHVVLRY